MPSSAYLVRMTSPQLSVRSARARDLAHELSRLEKRPIHAIVEDALTAYAQRQPVETAAAFLKRTRAIGAGVLTDADIVEVEAFIESNRRPHRGIDL
jgi:hypothetical protein